MAKCCFNSKEILRCKYDFLSINDEKKKMSEMENSYKPSIISGHVNWWMMPLVEFSHKCRLWPPIPNPLSNSLLKTDLIFENTYIWRWVVYYLLSETPGNFGYFSGMNEMFRDSRLFVDKFTGEPPGKKQSPTPWYW